MTDPRHSRALNVLRAEQGYAAAILVYVTATGSIGYADATHPDLIDERRGDVAGAAREALDAASGGLSAVAARIVTGQYKL